MTPQEPLLQKYTLKIYSDWWIPSFIIRLMIDGYDVQVMLMAVSCMYVLTLALSTYFGELARHDLIA